MNIEITCKSHTTLPLSELKWFQGNLAELSEESNQKLKNAILDNGIFLAFSVWENEGNKYICEHNRTLN